MANFTGQHLAGASARRKNALSGFLKFEKAFEEAKRNKQHELLKQERQFYYNAELNRRQNAAALARTKESNQGANIRQGVSSGQLEFVQQAEGVQGIADEQRETPAAIEVSEVESNIEKKLQKILADENQPEKIKKIAKRRLDKLHEQFSKRAGAVAPTPQGEVVTKKGGLGIQIRKPSALPFKEGEFNVELGGVVVRDPKSSTGFKVIKGRPADVTGAPKGFQNRVRVGNKEVFEDATGKLQQIALGSQSSEDNPPVVGTIEVDGQKFMTVDGKPTKKLDNVKQKAVGVLSPLVRGGRSLDMILAVWQGAGLALDDPELAEVLKAHPKYKRIKREMKKVYGVNL